MSSLRWRKGDNVTAVPAQALVVRYRHWPNREWGDWFGHRIEPVGYVPKGDEWWVSCADLEPTPS